jgi:hypothetical protein
LTLHVCNPYAFPLLLEVVGIEACIEDGSCNVPLEFNSTRAIELPPSLSGCNNVSEVDLSVTPSAFGVVSIKVTFLGLFYCANVFDVAS